MNTSDLSFRHRQLLHTLSIQSHYITGKELAEQLHVTPRTIRSDIRELEERLTGSGVSIVSRHHYGYRLEADDPAVLHDLKRASSSFLSRSDRIRYMVFRLVLADEPLDLGDLEDEMFISSTTLEQDLLFLRKKYLLPAPHISLTRSRNMIRLEEDERKRRSLLCLLFSEEWDYQDRGNLYHSLHYIDPVVMDTVIRKCVYHLSAHSIRMDDINLILLELMIAVSYHRIRTGHVLTLTGDVQAMLISTMNPTSIQTADEILDDLEQCLGIIFPEAERMDVYHRISISRLLNPDELNVDKVFSIYPKNIFSFANAYLQRVHFFFGIDMGSIDTFYVILLQYLYYLSRPEHALSIVQSRSSGTIDYMFELELAYVIQPLALDFYGNYLSFDELLYLAYTIRGAIAAENRNAAPASALLFCHLNLPAAWALKQRIQERFGEFLTITEMLPMYSKDDTGRGSYDIIISTTDKPVNLIPGQLSLSISPFFSQDDELKIAAALRKIQRNRLFPSCFPSFSDLLREATWLSELDAEDYPSLLEVLAEDLLSKGVISYEYLQDLLRREAVVSFAVRPGLILAHSSVPAKRTCLTIGTLKHRVRRHDYKIRGVLLLTMTEKDLPMIFSLTEEFYSGVHSDGNTSHLLTKEDICRFYKADD